MNPVEYLIFKSKTQGGSPAVLVGDQALTFEGLLKAVERRACEIDTQLNGRNDGLVSIALSHPVDEWVTVLACFYLGVCSTSHPPVGALPPQHQPTMWVLDTHPSKPLSVPYVLVGGKEISIVKPLPKPARVGPDKIARVFFTSGTTGQSKPVAVSFGKLITRALMRSTNRGMVGALITMMPVGSGGGLNQALHALSVGAPIALSPTVEAISQLVTTWGVDSIYASPNQLGHLLTQLKQQKATLEVPSLYLVGSAVTPHLWKLIQQYIPRVQLYSVCGATETGNIAVKQVNDAADLGRWGVTGPGVELQIVDRTGQELPDGQTGAIRIKTPYMASQYLDTGRAIDGEWFYTGDLGCRDETGDIVFEGRSDEVVNLDGVKVSLHPLEHYLQAQAEVVDSAAFVVVNPQGLQEIWAAVHLHDLQSLDALANKIQKALKLQHQPKRLLPVAFIPRTYTGKPQRHLMAEKVAELLQSECSTDNKNT